MIKEIDAILYKRKDIKLYKNQIKAIKTLLDLGGIEVKTGEGKTLIIAALSIILLKEKFKEKIFIVTTNDYLAKRDFEEFEIIYKDFNIKSCVNNMDNIDEILNSQIVYTSTNNLMFLYLNSILNNEYKLNLDTVIVDEADYTLIDCANTGCTISKGENLSFLKEISKFKICNSLIKTLNGTTNLNLLNSNYDFVIDKLNENIFLTEFGIEHINKLIRKDITSDIELYGILLSVLKAKYIYIKDIDYIVSDKIIWIDNNNKRLMKSCKKDINIQIALELKEDIKISSKGLEEISLSYQVFFDLFKDKYFLSGTLLEVENELKDLYGVSVKKIKSNFKSNIKISNPVIFKEEENFKYNILKKIKEISPYPIVIFEENDVKAKRIYEFLESNNIKSNLLLTSNYEDTELKLIQNAGNLNNILITTPLCSRGVDIKINEDLKNIGLTSIILFLPNNDRVFRQIIGRVGRNGFNGEVNCFININDDYILKDYKDIDDDKLLKKRNEILKKKLIEEKNNRRYLFTLDKLLYDKYITIINSIKEIDLNIISKKFLNESDINTIDTLILNNTRALIDKIFYNIFLYNLNITFNEFKNEIYRIGKEYNINDISYKGLYKFNYILNDEFNNYFYDLILISLKSLCNLKNINYKKGVNVN